jgi:hypothetical protein
MKKVISAQTIRKTFKEGKREIYAPPGGCIITPEAQTLAKDLGITLTSDSARELTGGKIDINEGLIREIVSRVYQQIPDAESRADEIRKAIMEVISEYQKK